MGSFGLRHRTNTRATRACSIGCAGAPMSRRIVVASLAAGAVLALAVTGTAQAVVTPAPTTVTIGNRDGTRLPSRYLGFSLPLDGLDTPAITTGNLPQLMRTLGT